ncbi:MAG: type IV pili twitching motility protein PilT [Planctomycetaceae bacterium TMED10]|nr:MAG: type IV pili twitching motility protein PilT [Planctomycetaceae bacterium TMED10]
MAEIDIFLRAMVEHGASDVHLVVGQSPKFALHGHVTPIPEFKDRILESDELKEILFAILDAEQISTYESHWDIDFAYEIKDVARFRCNYYFQRTGYGAVMRVIPSEILTLDQLHMPPVLRSLADLRSGLVLATGPTGSGKTTTLAAMVDHINTDSSRRIITIEDPVEFVHPNKQSIISHREVGTHTNSFKAGLRAVTRQDADVVLVGELRDLETMALALSAAAMGTLVFGTLHTNSAAKTIDRIIDIFPVTQQAQVRTVLAESLAGIVAQQLLRKKGGKGRVAATEILTGNHAVASIIREGKIERITSVIQAGKREGMQLLDDALEKMASAGVIEGSDAYMKANEKRRFEQYMKE